MLIENTLYGTVDKVQDAISVLQEHEPPEGYYVASQRLFGRNAFLTKKETIEAWNRRYD